ncbi:unnamed protein product, partial [Choristocarpus tenellus]
GWTPAHSAAVANHGRTISLLHRAGADLRLQDMTGSTPAHFAASSNCVQALQAIFGCYGDPSVLSTCAHNGMAPAHMAAMFDNLEALETLHDVGVDLDIRDNA